MPASPSLSTLRQWLLVEPLIKPGELQRSENYEGAASIGVE